MDPDSKDIVNILPHHTRGFLYMSCRKFFSNLPMNKLAYDSAISGDVLHDGSIGGDNGLSWITRFMDFWEQVQPSHLRLVGGQEVSGVAFN